MKKVLLVLLVGIIGFSSCGLSPKKRFERETNRMVKEALSRKNYVIPDSLFSFFPKDSRQYDFLKLGVVSENIKKREDEDKDQGPSWDFYCTELIEVYLSDSVDLLQPFIDEYRSLALSSTRSEDNNYFVIASESDLSEEYELSQLKGRYLLAKDEPLVPYFKTIESEVPFLSERTTICGLSPGYEILTLKQGNEIVLPKSRLYEWSVLPHEIRHGYRSGVAFKEEEPYMIYWIISW